MTREDWWLAGLVTDTPQAVVRSIEVECHPQGVSRDEATDEPNSGPATTAPATTDASAPTSTSATELLP